ncbi:uncharacterized protein LOC129577947 [Sitodiplosis mosellana]|uniref:uncharacterized protein LOC129577947 n=1 Tax=Sitodiplosis mosellana TaxID=263140 RepID=UPI002444848F|nr:uncharacterized protein LOC129577947 [Sitodiplosis mosellana]XP_055321800.1 uncharacterized protein LOC129577947 [Sitodiplosis mosellana]
MGRKRIGAHTIRGNRSKPRKVEDGKQKEEKAYFAIKLAATSIVRPEYRDRILPWITKTSIKCTEISELASLLFLNKVRAATEQAIITGNWEYFDDGDGMHIIENCFYAVLRRYKEDDFIMDPWFRHCFENVDIENRSAWPNNDYFGNLMKYLFQQYGRNVKTNLDTHAQKRLRYFLRLKAFRQNYTNRIRGLPDTYDERDVANAVSWAIKRYDATRGDANRLAKRDRLLRYVRDIRGPADDDIAKFTKDEDTWFSSLPMWLIMQSEIETHLNWVEQHHDNIVQVIALPNIKNLVVIPICHHTRKAVRIDADVLYRMMCETGTSPRDEYGRQHTVGHVTSKSNQAYYFNMIFNMEKINRVLKANKKFEHILSDGVSASILYSVKKTVVDKLVEDGLVRKRYSDGFYVYELGIDWGMKTWNATVRRRINNDKERIHNGKEMNFTINSKKYHYGTEEGVRKEKRERWTRAFGQFEESDRNNRVRYDRMPSPKGSNWRDYIQHRLTIMKKAIAVYTTKKYTRLSFDHYIESNRVSDKVAAMLTNRKRCIINIGASQPPANSPIQIKKHVRCPGVRKLVKSFKKMEGNVIRFVNEARSSRLCARCFEPFPLSTLNDRVKVCEWCMPDQDDWPDGMKLPEKIVAAKSKRKLRSERRAMRQAAVQNPNQPRGFVSKVICYRKNWQQNAANGMDDNVEERRGVIIHDAELGIIEYTDEYVPEDPVDDSPVLKTVWQRDISAAKLILYRGHCELFGHRLHDAFTRQHLVYPTRFRVNFNIH